MNKGFTLVELLAVIVIISILSLILVISVNGIIKNSKEKLSDLQIETIEKAAQTYFLKDGMNKIDYEATKFELCVELAYLIENGYFDNSEIIDPDTKESITGSVKINYESNQYTYTYQENTCSDMNY